MLKALAAAWVAVAVAGLSGRCLGEERGGVGKPISGTFLQIDAVTSEWSGEEWGEEFRYMREFGIDTVIVQFSVAGGAFYDSERWPSYGGRRGNWSLDAIVRSCEEEGMGCFLGLTAYDWEAGGAPLEGFVRGSLVTGEELAERYGSSPAVRGLYVSDELGTPSRVSDERVQGAGAVIRGLRRMRPEWRYAIAPFYVDGGQRDYYLWWREVLGVVKPDIVMLQDGVGCGRVESAAHSRIYFWAMQRACREEGVALWADVEMFTPELTSAPWERVRRQLAAVSRYVEKTVIFEFNHYVSPLRTDGSLYWWYLRSREREEGTRSN